MVPQMIPKKIIHELGARERERSGEVGLHFKEGLSHDYFSRNLNWSFNNAQNILRRIKKLFHTEVSILNYFILQVTF